jgi:hypothetical protein
MNGAVLALAVSGSDLYAGGDFRMAGGLPASCIAKWDGSNWSPLGSGIGRGLRSPRVFALSASDRDLYAAGNFTTAGGKVSAYVARAYLGVLGPRITCPPSTNVDCGQSATLTALVTNSSGLPLTVVWDVNGQVAQTNSFPGSDAATNFSVSFASALPSGTNNVTVTVTDSLTNSDSCSTFVTVVDRTAPVFSSASAVPDRLWPPDHRMVAVQVSASVTDACDDAPTWKIIEVLSNDSSSRPGLDWIITGDSTVLLRAAKSGPAERVYSIRLQAIDSSGNLSEVQAVNVTVLVLRLPKGTLT